MIARVAPGEAPPMISDPIHASIRKMGLEAFALYFAAPEELDAVFAEALRKEANAIYMSAFPQLTWDEAVQRKVIGLAAAHRIPTGYELPELAPPGLQATLLVQADRVIE